MPDYESKGHNYQKKLLEFLRKHPELRGKKGLNVIDILHDQWCAVYKNGFCNCDPDIRLRRPENN